MRLAILRLAIQCLAVVLAATASISYFKYQRDLQGVVAGQQMYVAVDETLWQHAQPSLSDLRIMSGDNGVPYVLTVERGSSENEQKDVPVLQPGMLGANTQFFLDMNGLAEYDRIHLRLAGQNFVVKARVEGSDDLHGQQWTLLGNSVLYDLSSDGLGANSTLRLRRAINRYLRVTLEGEIKPSQVLGAWAAIRYEEREIWRNVGTLVPVVRTVRLRDDIFDFTIPAGVPVERVEFAIDPAQPNFRRTVEIEGDDREPLGSGEICRIHTVRHGQKIDVEQSSVGIRSSRSRNIRITVRNGDDQPLKITTVHLQQYERRIYFNAAAASGTFRLYYGDEKLDAPVYDYAQLFQKDPKAVAAQLSPEQSNTAFTGRPDDRPWSEQHPAILWIAIIVTVLVLGGLAIRSLKPAAP